jgi:hypothetical protein
MSVSYDQATQNSRLDATLARIDNNASPATMEICTAAYAAVLVIITLSKPSFSRGGTSPSTALTLLGVPKSGTASGAGTQTAAVARIKDGGGVVIVNNLTVGTSASDVVLNSLSITNGQTVTISSGTITHAA